MEKFAVACIQIAPSPNAISENTEKCLAWIDAAVRDFRPRLVVLQETVTTGFSPGMPREEFYDLVEPIDGPSACAVARLARDRKTAVLFPMYEKGAEAPVVYNSALLFDERGERRGLYRKTHPFPTERIEGGGWTTPGNSLDVFDLGFVKVGVTICYEGDFPEPSRILSLKGAEVILRPSALLRSFEIWELTNRARAYDNHVYVVGVNAVGSDAAGNHYFGHSMVVDPIARKLAQARGTEEIIGVELDPEPLKYVTYGAHSPMLFDHIEDRNLDVYDGLLAEGRCPFEPSRRIPYR
ncbi:MAG: carbon-nitrogen hydrolase family protein [Candidatus Hydrogenedentota bacterium]|nr:MAG: carbon-nitrogen hydrolase family protein [Candidatus Hydrogenedentota bacterium]